MVSNNLKTHFLVTSVNCSSPAALLIKILKGSTLSGQTESSAQST